MPQPILYVGITNHGFGHATRTAAIVDQIQQLCPDLVPIFVTAAPRWLLESYIQGDFIHRPRTFDVGVVQSDSITMDQPATLEKLKDIRKRSNSLIASEVSFIRQNRVGLVLADIPPLAAAIAHAAGIPCWMASNFGWDLIYRPWGGEFIEQADWISDLFGKCDRLFRLPFHEPMDAFPHIIDTGLTGGSPRHAVAELKSLFGITAPPERVALLSFGGLGLNALPYANVTQFPDWQFLTFDRQAPDLPNLIKVTDQTYRPVDIMPLCGQVISKPGYGTFAEACRLGIPITTLTRHDFAEAAFLVAGIQDYMYHRVLEPEEFFQGTWEFLRQPLQPPRKSEPLALDGNEAIARAVIDFFH